MKKKLILISFFSMHFNSAYAIVNGEDAQPDEFPWVAKITHGSTAIENLSIKNGCTGTLISKDTILTAAHCLVGKQGSLDNFKISFPNYSNQAEVYSVSSIHIHPSFNVPITKIFETTEVDEDGDEYQTFDLQSYVIHDIGLIKLQREVTGITPISINTVNKDNDVFYGMGYGVRGEVTSKEEGNTLAKIDLNLLDVEICKQYAFTSNSEITSEIKNTTGVGPLASSINSYCTTGVKSFSSACHGDSGSPLIQINDGKPYVLGVLSSGASVACAHESSYKHTPNLYTSAAEYQYFVNSVMSGDTNLNKHKNLIENAYNDKANGEGWTFNDKDRFYISDQEYFRWSFLHKYLLTINANTFLAVESLAETASEEVKDLFRKYPDGNFLQADIQDIPKVPSFFATSYLPAERHQIIDLVEKTGLSMLELAEVRPNIIVSEVFTRTYCGGDRYFMNATLLDENHKLIKAYSTGDRYLEGGCDWITDWKEARFNIPYVDGVRYVRFEDGGQDSENWEGFFGPRMTDASVRLNTEDVSWSR